MYTCMIECTVAAKTIGIFSFPMEPESWGRTTGCFGALAHGLFTYESE